MYGGIPCWGRTRLNPSISLRDWRCCCGLRFNRSNILSRFRCRPLRTHRFKQCKRFRLRFLGPASRTQRIFLGGFQWFDIHSIIAFAKNSSPHLLVCAFSHTCISRFATSCSPRGIAAHHRHFTSFKIVAQITFLYSLFTNRLLQVAILKSGSEISSF